MAWTHDLENPEEDARARKLTFTPDQAGFVAHHIRNAIQGAPVNLERAHERILATVVAIEKRVTLGVKADVSHGAGRTP